MLNGVRCGVFTRNAQGGVIFHPAPPPGPRELGAIVERTYRKAIAWLRRRGYLGERALEVGSGEQSALDACAALAMQRGQVATLARPGAKDAADEDHDRSPENKEVAVEHQGFNLHAGVRIDAGNDLGRERLARYALRPPLSLERLRRLPGGRIACRLKYVSGDDRDEWRRFDRGKRAQNRRNLERLAAIIQSSKRRRFP